METQYIQTRAGAAGRGDQRRRGRAARQSDHWRNAVIAGNSLRADLQGNAAGDADNAPTKHTPKASRHLHATTAAGRTRANGQTHSTGKTYRAADLTRSQTSATSAESF